MENDIENLTSEQEDKLKAEHAKDYHGTDDDMPDAFENWLGYLSTEDIKKIEEQPTVNAEAYELWLRGTEFQRQSTREGYERAIKYYENKNYDDSFKLCSNIIGKNPNQFIAQNIMHYMKII